MSHLDKLVQSTLSHRTMRQAMSQKALELAAELEDQRQSDQKDLAPPPPPQRPADGGNGQAAGSPPAA